MIRCYVVTRRYLPNCSDVDREPVSMFLFDIDRLKSSLPKILHLCFVLVFWIVLPCSVIVAALAGDYLESAFNDK